LYSQNTFFERLKEKKEHFSPKQAQLVKYIVNNYKKAAFQNLTQIAKESEVSEATIVRLADALGYSGFSEMSEDLQKIVQHELSTLERFKNTAKEDNLNTFELIINNDQKNLNRLLKTISFEVIEQVVCSIENSEQIIIAGFHHSTYLAEFFGYTLGKLKSSVTILSRNNIDFHNSLISCNEKTTAIMFSFPRYPKIIQKLGKMFQEKNVNVIGITDNILSPVKNVTDQLLIVPMQYVTFTDHCSSVLTLIQAIIVEYASRNPQITEQNFQEFDKYVDNLDIF
jgi:DNA-binding MurR/RpiR family transcriptional regulator